MSDTIAVSLKGPYADNEALYATDLDVGEEVVVDEVRDADFARARIGIRNPNSLRARLRRLPWCGGGRRDSDGHDNGRRENGCVHE